MNIVATLKSKLTRPSAVWLLIVIPVLLLITKWCGGLQNNTVQYKVDVFAKPETAPLLFVGGYISSGTTLLRVLLDAHPMIRCGSEAKTIKFLFGYRNEMSRSNINWAREAGVYPDVLDHAIAQYVLTTMREMGPPADILCYKRPMLIRYMDQLAKMFPRAKFIHILRDGRASASSSLTRGISGGSNASRELKKWSNGVTEVLVKCQNLTEERCLTIRYERLVLNPETELRTVTEFLRIPWDLRMLSHHTMLENITQLSKHEPSTARVKQKIDTQSLTKWYTDDQTRGRYLRTVDKDIPLLRLLGFIQCGKPPDYTRLSEKVWLNVSELRKS